MLRLATSLCLLTFASLSCDNVFDPRAPLQQQIVVYSVLSTDRDAQFVQVQTDYMPPGYDPLSSNSDNSVSGALVSIETGGRIYRFRDTVISRSDTSRYKFPIHVYYLSPFTPQRGKSIQVTVQSATYCQVSASAIVPDKPKITLDAGAVQSSTDRTRIRWIPL